MDTGPALVSQRWSQAGCDAPTPEFVAVWLGVVSAITLDQPRLTGGPPAAAAQRRHRVEEREQLGDVVAIGRRQRGDDRNPVRVGENMMLRPGFAAIGRVRSSLSPRATRGLTSCRPAPGPDRGAPVTQLAEQGRMQRFHTPARCQRTSRRQHVVPEPQPISRGSMSMDPAAQNEQDARQHGSVGNRPASRIAVIPGTTFRQQRLGAGP